MIINLGRLKPNLLLLAIPMVVLGFSGYPSSLLFQSAQAEDAGNLYNTPSTSGWSDQYCLASTKTMMKPAPEFNGQLRAQVQMPALTSSEKGAGTPCCLAADVLRHRWQLGCS